MKKPAPADHPIHRIIAERWSPRAFSDKSIAESDLLTMLEAARWAPSCSNDQPWRFVVAKKEDSTAFERILGCLTPANRRWARQAAVLMIAVARTRFSHNGALNRHALYDTGQAVALLTIQATALGIRVHQMAGFSAEKTIEAFSIPEEHQPITTIALGYPGDPQTLPEQLRVKESAPRTRRLLSDLVLPGSSTGLLPHP